MSLYAKLWTDILGDEKLMRAARKGAKHLVILPWLFAFAKKADDDGRLTVGGEPAEPDDIAQGIPGVTTKHVALCLSALLEIGVLAEDDDGVLRLTAWERRSGAGGSSKPSSTPERVRDRVTRHRQRKRAEEGASNADGVTPSNATPVTPETPGETPGVTSYARSRELELEKELDQELELEREKNDDSNRAREDTDQVAMERRLLGRLGEHASTVVRFLDTRPSRARLPWVGRIGAAIDEPPHYTPAEVATALEELLTSASEPMPAAFRAFCKRIRDERTTPGSSPNGGHQRQHRPNAGDQQVANILGAIGTDP